MALPTILHLTDLHFGPSKNKGHWWNSDATELRLPKYDRKGLLGSLLDDLQISRVVPNIVIVSGDLLDRGARAGVSQAVAFLKKLAEQLNIPVQNIVLVPGNHDVLRTSSEADRYSLFDRVRTDFYGKARRGFRLRIKPYQRVELFDFSDQFQLEVVAFNSCETLNPPDNEHGSVGRAQRDVAKRLLAASRDNHTIRVAVMHHHLVSPVGVLLREETSVMEDAASLQHWLAEHRFRLVVHGHHHVDWQEIRTINNWTMAISAGASAGVGGYGRNYWSLPLGYQIFQFESSERGKRIRREYDPQSMKWTAARGAHEMELWFGATQMDLREGMKARGSSNPTKSSVRAVVRAMFRLDSQFEAFCVDHFPSVKREFSAGMPRTQRENMLLEMSDSGEILAALRTVDGFSQCETMIVYE